MNNLYRIALSTCLFMALLLPRTFAQEAKTAKQIINEGVKLHDDGKYEEAIAKYNAALKVEPNNTIADFEIALSLYMQNKYKDALPHLERLLKLRTKDRGEVYELLGTIQDDMGQPAKAIAYYKEGIKQEPDFARLYYNLGVTYYGQKQYAEAEKCAVTAIKLNKNHVGSHKLYADASFYLGKKLNALLAYSYTLLLEPSKDRSKKSLKQIDSVFVKALSKNSSISNNYVTANGVSPVYVAETSINMAASAAEDLKKKGMEDPVDLLEFKLNMVFKASGKVADAKGASTDILYGYAGYFYKLSQTDNMPFFARYISLSKQYDSDAKWFEDNDAKLKAFAAWADANPIKF